VSKRIARISAASDVSPHAFMLEAIREKLEAEEARAAFLTEGMRRLEAMKKTGKGIPADEVFRSFEALARGSKPKRPVARKPR
jgi:predicted transcriptional regulator